MDVKDEIEGLVKRLYVSNFTCDGHGYCRIMPRGIKEIERDEKKTTEWEVNTDKIGVNRKKEEVKQISACSANSH